MFSLLRKKDNLSQSSKVSTSCPSINSPGTDERSSNASHDSTGSSDSDGEGIPKASRSQRLFARRSIRHQRKREKDFEKKIKHNKITMDDYLSKQAEFKLWLSEEKHKTINNMKSPKTKAYFKAFVKLWNKRKLPQKYYRGTVSCETPANSTGRQRFNLVSLADSPFPNSVSFPQTIDLSHEGSILSDSPFSTFGKSPGNPVLPVNKTPGSGYDLLDLKRKAIFNNMGKEDQQQKYSDQSNNSDDYTCLHSKKSDSSSHSSSEASGSGSVSDSPRSSRSSKIRKEKEENLYKVTVLSWTSKGELQVRPSSANPQLQDTPESHTIDPDILAKHISSHEYSSIHEDAVSDVLDPTYCVVGFPASSYSQPYNCPKRFSTKDNFDDSVFVTEKQNLNENIPETGVSIEDLYAVPIKKKKSSDQSETVSTTSNESTTQLDHKIGNKCQMEMDKLSDIITSGSDFSITSGSSSESLNNTHLLVPGQEGLGKASSAPELSTILEGDITKLVDKSYDERGNFTNVTAINTTCLNNTSYKDNVPQSGNNSYVDMSHWKNKMKPQANTVTTNTTMVIEDVNAEHDWKMRKLVDFGNVTSSTPDRKRNLSDPSRQNTFGNVLEHNSVPGEETRLSTRTLSDPTRSGPGNLLPPPLDMDYQSGNASESEKELISQSDVPLITIQTPARSDVNSPCQESWPTPPPDLDETPGSELDNYKTSDSDIWPSPPTPYDFCKADIITKQIQNSDMLWPSPPAQTNQSISDSVFEEAQPWPTPPAPQDIKESADTLEPSTNSDDEPPKLVTADFISNQQKIKTGLNKDTQHHINVPVLKLSQLQNIPMVQQQLNKMADQEDGLKILNVNLPVATEINPCDRSSNNLKENLLPVKLDQNTQEEENRTINQTKVFSENHITTSIERFETDIDSVIDGSQTEVFENIKTKKRMVLETVV